MKFTIEGPIKDNIYNLMRKAGYNLQKKEEEEFSFLRPPRGFPRFHLFLKWQGENLLCNLHLDQKRPVYKGAPAHSGEHNTEVIKEEIERIKNICR